MKKIKSWVLLGAGPNADGSCLGQDSKPSDGSCCWHNQKIDVFSQVQECRSNKEPGKTGVEPQGG